jgi:hypothetical protein
VTRTRAFVNPVYGEERLCPLFQFVYSRSTHLQLTLLCKLSESSLALLVMRLVQVHYPSGIPTEGRQLRVLLFPAQGNHDQQRSLSLTVYDLDYGLHNRGIGIRFVAGERDLSLLYSVHTVLGPTQPAMQRVVEELSSGIKRSKREACHLPPSNAEIMPIIPPISPLS